jgi:uncharacterized protein
MSLLQRPNQTDQYLTSSAIAAGAVQYQQGLAAASQPVGKPWREADDSADVAAAIRICSRRGSGWYNLMAMLHGDPETTAGADAVAVSIAILAEAPVPGIANARLAPWQSADTLQARLIERTVGTAKAAGVGPVTLWITHDHRHPAVETIAGLLGVALAEQPGGDIGDRMLAAIAAAPGPAIVIGTDCRALAPAHLRDTATLLRDGVDVVIVPAGDGGYGLIGMRRPQPALFAGMTSGPTWNTGSVMAETRRRLRA